jgi:hypothetical protein
MKNTTQNSENTTLNCGKYYFSKIEILLSFGNNTTQNYENKQV